MSDTATKVREIIAQNMRIDLEAVKPESSLSDDLKADSLTQVELAMELENTLNIKIPEEVAEKFKTVGDIISYCEESSKA